MLFLRSVEELVVRGVILLWVVGLRFEGFRILIGEYLSFVSRILLSLSNAFLILWIELLFLTLLLVHALSVSSVISIKDMMNLGASSLLASVSCTFVKM